LNLDKGVGEFPTPFSLLHFPTTETMSLAFITKRFPESIICDPSGLEMAPGDQVRLTLNTGVEPGFPASIAGVVQTPVHRVQMLAPNRRRVLGYEYIIGYDTEDLDGASAGLTSDLVTAVGCVTCCQVLSDALVAEREARIAGDLAASNFLAYNPSITGVTGGGASKLDGIVTVGVAAGKAQLVRTSAGNMSLYLLEASTSAEAPPGIVRPDDYNGATNAKVWRQIVFSVQTSIAAVAHFIGGGGVLGQVRIADATFKVDQLTPGIDRAMQLSDADGNVSIIPPFADDGEANAAVDVGDAWYDTTLKKTRVRLS
jgi:hypothetical protein